MNPEIRKLIMRQNVNNDQLNFDPFIKFLFSGML